MYDGVPYVLGELIEKEKRLVVLSSHPQENLEIEAERYGIKGFFEMMRSVGSNGKVDGLRGLCEDMNVKPDKLLYLGDTVFDIRAGKEVGVRTAGVCTGYHSRERD
tara:strand:- start:389 stop:706 length:318 start_codon:yes stop_codon:yes gene_type:complete